MERLFTVYKTTNILNNRYYIGVHITEDVNDDYLGSGDRIRHEVKKYGPENFVKEIIDIFDNPDDMFELEARLVNEDLIKDPLCLNLKKGGQGGWPSWLRNDPKRIKRTREWIRTGAWSQAGNKALTEMRANGWVNPGFTGRKHSDEHKRHMSNIMPAKTRGEKNSQYGTCWIYSMEEKVSKKIPKTDLDLWVKKGWTPGRKMKFD